jgi:3-deoxy-D-manno-octulosonic acid kinase
VKEWRDGAHHVAYDAAALTEPRTGLFDASHWERAGLVEGRAPGRGSVVFVRGGARGEVWALRHYRRGGWLGRLVADSYVWLGLRQTRPWREFQLTAGLHAQGLPVPRPVAAHVARGLLAYRGDLITVRIEGTQTLADALERAALPADQWTQLGRMLRRFHAAGVRHDDINGRNVLRDAQGVFHLIDFDKARLLPSGPWQAQNLARFRRSLEKFKATSPTFHFTDADWQALLSGYNAR